MSSDCCVVQSVHFPPSPLHAALHSQVTWSWSLPYIRNQNNIAPPYINYFLLPPIAPIQQTLGAFDENNLPLSQSYYQDQVATGKIPIFKNVYSTLAPLSTPHPPSLPPSQTTSWRACLELISLELRSGTGAEAAFAVVQEMLLHRQAPHKSVGRLWASAIQLCNELGKRQGRNFKAIEMFDLAREQVGKAGEVWCEGARMHMDPLQEELFNLDKAEGYLQLAMKYTPQFGDPFVEYVKLGLLKYGRGGTWFADLSRTVAIAEPNYGQMWQFCKRSSIQTFREILAHAVDLVALELHIYSSLYQPLLMGASDSESTAATRTSFRLQLPWFFVTALPTLNYQTRSIAALPDNARRQIIFGSETLSP